MREPLVSVVLPTHNRKALLARAMASVLAQSYRNLECIVVDDASSDGTAEQVERCSDPRIRYIRHETNQHVSAARNTGIEAAKGDLIAFLDDDDEWLPPKLDRQVALLLDSPSSVGMVYTWMDYIDPTGRVVRQHHPSLRGRIFPDVLDRQRIGGTPSLLVRRAVAERVGGFDTELRRGNDGDFIRRVCYEWEVDVVPEVLVKVHVGHAHDRITAQDRRGIENAIRGNAVKLEKFAEVLPRYPKKEASIRARIGLHHAELGQWRESASCFRRALSLSLTTREVYGDLRRAVALLIR